MTNMHNVVYILEFFCVGLLELPLKNINKINFHPVSYLMIVSSDVDKAEVWTSCWVQCRRVPRSESPAAGPSVCPGPLVYPQSSVQGTGTPTGTQDHCPQTEGGNEN